MPSILGDGTHWVFVNDAFSELLGYSRAELEAETWEKLVHPDDVESTRAATQEVLAEKRLGECVNRYRAKDGHYVECRWKWGPPNDTGYTWAVIVDYTELDDE